MRRYVHEAVVDTPPDKLWRAIVDVRRWPEWDAGLEAIELQGDLPLAKMRGSHEFRVEPGGTRIRVTIEVWGPLGFLWDRVVARKVAQDAGAQTEALVRFAERLS